MGRVLVVLALLWSACAAVPANCAQLAQGFQTQLGSSVSTPILQNVSLNVGALTPASFGQVYLDSPFLKLIPPIFAPDPTLSSWSISSTSAHANYWNVGGTTGANAVSATPICVTGTGGTTGITTPFPNATGTAAGLGGNGAQYVFNVAVYLSSTSCAGAPDGSAQLAVNIVGGAANFSEININASPSWQHNLLGGGTPTAFLTAAQAQSCGASSCVAAQQLISTGANLTPSSHSPISGPPQLGGGSSITASFPGTSYNGFIDDGHSTGCGTAPCYDGIAGNVLTVLTTVSGALAVGQDVQGAPSDGNVAPAGLIDYGTSIVSGSGSTWTVSTPQARPPCDATGASLPAPNFLQGCMWATSVFVRYADPTKPAGTPFGFSFANNQNPGNEVSYMTEDSLVFDNKSDAYGGVNTGIIFGHNAAGPGYQAVDHIALENLSWSFLPSNYFYPVSNNAFNTLLFGSAFGAVDIALKNLHFSNPLFAINIGTSSNIYNIGIDKTVMRDVLVRGIVFGSPVNFTMQDVTIMAPTYFQSAAGHMDATQVTNGATPHNFQGRRVAVLQAEGNALWQEGPFFMNPSQSVVGFVDDGQCSGAGAACTTSSTPAACAVVASNPTTSPCYDGNPGNQLYVTSTAVDGLPSGTVEAYDYNRMRLPDGTIVGIVFNAGTGTKHGVGQYTLTSGYYGASGAGLNETVAPGTTIWAQGLTGLINGHIVAGVDANAQWNSNAAGLTVENFGYVTSNTGNNCTPSGPNSCPLPTVSTPSNTTNNFMGYITAGQLTVTSLVGPFQTLPGPTICDVVTGPGVVSTGTPTGVPAVCGPAVANSTQITVVPNSTSGNPLMGPLPQTFTVSPSQTVGSAGAPVQMQSYPFGYAAMFAPTLVITSADANHFFGAGVTYSGGFAEGAKPSAGTGAISFTNTTFAGTACDANYFANGSPNAGPSQPAGTCQDPTGGCLNSFTPTQWAAMTDAQAADRYAFCLTPSGTLAPFGPITTGGKWNDGSGKNIYPG